MLRGWDNLDNQNPFQDAPESPNGDLLSHNEVLEDQQQEQSGNEVEILRDWTVAGERDEEKVEESAVGRKLVCVAVEENSPPVWKEKATA